MKRILFSLALLITTEATWAWGPEGHMIVAQIAEDSLTSKARDQVAKLLDNQAMPDVANWADFIKSDPQWKHTAPWHFADVPDGIDYGHMTHPPEGDVISATTSLVAVLKDNTSSVTDKQNALKFIIHFVGDIHQPLHVGRPDDRGGNMVKVQFQGKNMNLHSLWDSGMITQQNMDYSSYAHYLEGMAFLAGYDIAEIPFSVIVAEDMGYRKDIYNFTPVANAPVVLSKAYMDRNIATMNARLLTGGKRLAALLNAVYK